MPCEEKEKGGPDSWREEEKPAVFRRVFPPFFSHLPTTVFDAVCAALDGHVVPTRRITFATAVAHLSYSHFARVHRGHPKGSSYHPPPTHCYSSHRGDEMEWGSSPQCAAEENDGIHPACTLPHRASNAKVVVLSRKMKEQKIVPRDGARFSALPDE